MFWLLGVAAFLLSKKLRIGSKGLKEGTNDVGLLNLTGLFLSCCCCCLPLNCVLIKLLP